MNKNAATYFLSFSLLCLAGALVFFTIKLVEVSHALPPLVQSIEKTAEKITPIVDEVASVREAVPSILNEIEQVRSLVPLITNEMAELEKRIPDIIAEVEQVRASIPSVLEEVAAVRELVPEVLVRLDNIEKQVPSMVGSVNGFAQTLHDTNQKIPEVLAEVKQTREIIPPTLSRTEAMVENLGNVGKTTGEDAVYGVVSGLFKAPLKIVGGLGKAIIEPFEKSATWVNNEDKEIIEELIRQLLRDDSSSVYEKRNPQNKNLSRASLAEIKRINRNDCKVVHVEIESVNGLYVDNYITFCKTTRNTWEIYE